MVGPVARGPAGAVPDRAPAASGVVVVGSVHLDLQVEVPQLPGRGETVLGTGHRRTPGGKGANQAVAAAVAAGPPVALIGRVGDDDDGRLVRSEVEARGVDIRHVSVDRHDQTGIALVVVDRAGANQIAVSPGGSGRLSPDHLARAAPAIAGARVLLVQLEVLVETVQAAIDLAGEDTVVVLNPAPARPLPPALLRRVDVLVPNLVELGQLAGQPDLDRPDPDRLASDRLAPDRLGRIAAAARRLPGDHPVVVTLGADGALLVDGPATHHVPGQPVDAVDTTGAGDAFCGALAGALAAGDPLPAAVTAANRFAAMSTTRSGAFTSYLGGAAATR